MRSFIPVWIALAMALTACAPKGTSESAGDADTAVDSSAQEAVAAPEIASPAVVAPAEEVRIATGISVDVCKLPELSDVVEVFPYTLIGELGRCRDEGSSTIEIGITDKIYINSKDSSLSIFQMQSNQYDSMEAFISESFYEDQREDFKMEKDQVMSDRLGFDTMRVTYRLDSEENGAELVEGYCFNYGYADYCIAARSRGSSLNEFKDAFFSNMKLVTKTEAEIAKEQEELLKQRKEQWKRNNKEMIKNYGGVPKLQMQIPEVDGNMDRRIIQKVTKRHKGELRACYEKELPKTKGIKGKIVVNWVIDAQGSIIKAEVKETTVGNPDVENCFTNSIKHWRFPSPKGGGTVQVDFPFELELLTEMPD